MVGWDQICILKKMTLLGYSGSGDFREESITKIRRERKRGGGGGQWKWGGGLAGELWRERNGQDLVTGNEKEGEEGSR